MLFKEWKLSFEVKLQMFALNKPLFVAPEISNGADAYTHRQNPLRKLSTAFRFCFGHIHSVHLLWPMKHWNFVLIQLVYPNIKVMILYKMLLMVVKSQKLCKSLFTVMFCLFPLNFGTNALNFLFVTSSVYRG